jgi:hypothetical protein
MASSRRNFLRTGMLFALFAQVPSVLGSVLKDSHALSGAIDFSKETFARHLNTIFRIQLGNSRETHLKLVNIGDLAKRKGVVKGREHFSLLFVGPAHSSDLSQETYSIEHDSLGRFSLFLVPVGRPEDRHHEAVIHRF